MMHRVRPYQIFQHLGSDNKASLTIPTVRGTDSLTVSSLDTLLLIAVARIVKAGSILELGTGAGYTALHLARNTEAYIMTVDDERKPCVFEGTKWEHLIQRITEPVEKIQPINCDMVFCDINPTLGLCQRCTTLASQCAPKVIAWHDFENAGYPAQTENLNELSKTFDIYFVEESRMCFWFSDGRVL